MRAYTELDTLGRVYLIEWEDDKTQPISSTLIYDPKEIAKRLEQ